ncbi:uncharacterized protein [Montipora foliosa]|uniref:uncharacterized protein isoform X2 n=1 Tax=Montipora foliosa TaxID=591990 RepID=UPI0035F1A3BE
MAEYRFRQPKSVEDEERCVLNAIPKSTRYKNKWAARIFEEWGKARFPKVATLEPGGLFKEYDLHKVQSLEIPLLQMDALSVNYWLTKFVQEVAKPSKERYPPKTIYQIVCGLRRFMEENNEKLDFNPLDASDKSLLPRVLAKIRHDKALVLLIAPVWPTQSWYPLLLQLSTVQPILLPGLDNLLTLPHNPEQHPLRHKLHLAAWTLSGKLCQTRDFESKRLTSSVHLGQQALRNSTRECGTSGLAGVINGKLIYFKLLSSRLWSS